MMEFIKPWWDLLPNIFGALIIIIVGFFIAGVLKRLAQSLLSKINLDSHIGKFSGCPEDHPPRVTDFLANIIYYLTLVFVLMALLELFHLTALADPIKVLLGSILVYATRFLGAVVIILVAWLVAKMLRMATFGILESMQVDQKFAQRMPNISLAKNLSDIVFGLVFLFFLPAILDALALQGLLGPVNTLITKLLAFLPNLVGAVILVIIAWIVAEVLRKLTVTGLDALSLNERLGFAASPMSISQTMGNIIYGLVFLFFLPAILDTLALGGLLTPVNAMITKLLSFLPNLIGALLILLIAWLMARFVRSLSFSLLRASGLDDKVSAYMNQMSLAKTISDILYALTWLLFLPAILDTLSLQGLLTPINAMIGKILEFLPNLFAASILIVVSYICGRILAQIVSGLLAGFGVDSFLAKQGYVSAESKEYPPSRIIGMMVLFWVMLLAIMETAQVLGFSLLADLSAKFTVFAAQILLGVIIFALGLYLANWAHRAIISGGMTNAPLLAASARVAILVLSAAMALREMGIANDIINLAFGLLLGAVAVAVALAFGLGGREVAHRQLTQWSESINNTEKNP
jgi:hypothetical protein